MTVFVRKGFGTVHEVMKSPVEISSEQMGEAHNQANLIRALPVLASRRGRA